MIGISKVMTDIYKTLSPAEAKKRLDKEQDITLLDVRTPSEYAQKNIKGSINLPLDQLINKIESMISDKDSPVFVYCHSGSRSRSAVKLMLRWGYSNVYDLGGIIYWPYE